MLNQTKLGRVRTGTGTKQTMKKPIQIGTGTDTSRFCFQAKLKVNEKNYPTHDLKLVAMVFELKTWRHYLYGVHVDVFTHHKNLQYFFT